MTRRRGGHRKGFGKHGSVAEAGHVGGCAKHGKRVYLVRAAAKAAIRRLPDESGMREYRCDAIDGAWHIGHLHREVRHGRRTAREFYRVPASSRGTAGEP